MEQQTATNGEDRDSADGAPRGLHLWNRTEVVQRKNCPNHHVYFPAECAFAHTCWAGHGKAVTFFVAPSRRTRGRACRRPPNKILKF